MQCVEDKNVIKILLKNWTQMLIFFTNPCPVIRSETGQKTFSDQKQVFCLNIQHRHTFPPSQNILQPECTGWTRPLTFRVNKQSHVGWTLTQMEWTRTQISQIYDGYACTCRVNTARTIAHVGLCHEHALTLRMNTPIKSPPPQVLSIFTKERKCFPVLKPIQSLMISRFSLCPCICL